LLIDRRFPRRPLERRHDQRTWHDPGAVHHMRVLRPAVGIVAFYDGRVEGYRFAEDPNWVDDGALALGIASYAIVDGDEALIYDTHVSVDHARFVRDALQSRTTRPMRRRTARTSRP
jgi:hypothetical protein